jgi:hypothetical protein
MTIRNLILAASLLTSTATLASEFTYNNFTLDSETNIVNGQNLDWLQWDETVNLSLDDAMTIYSNQGWRVASRDEMSSLLNAFDFGFTFINSPTASQEIQAQLETGVASEHSQFIALFGDTNAAAGYDFATAASASIFGNYNDPSGLHGITEVVHDYSGINQSLLVTQYGNIAASSLREENIGIALVRASAVPVPGSALLLFSGLLALSGVRHKKRCNASY